MLQANYYDALELCGDGGALRDFGVEGFVVAFGSWGEDGAGLFDLGAEGEGEDEHESEHVAYSIRVLRAGVRSRRG